MASILLLKSLVEDLENSRRLKQAKLVTKTDFDGKLKKISVKKLTQIKQST